MNALALPAIAEDIWDMKYRLKDNQTGQPLDADIHATWARVAVALASAEPEHEPRPKHHAAFMRALTDYRFLPAGRIIAGAGAGRNVTLFNCYVMGAIEDDMASIFEHLKEAALTMQAGGGIGYDFSTLRPRGARVVGVGADASGPITFMDVWDAMCRTIMSAGHRRGAMMATLRCDHPDIEAFIHAKHEPGRLRMFNLSVLVTDAFMHAVRDNADWRLTFNGHLHKTISARRLWHQIMRATYAYAEPGVIFIDRINERNNLHYCENIQATNPCGEQPLPPYGACLLGSINLTRFIRNPFEDNATLDTPAFHATVSTAVRMLDNAIDVSQFPLEAQAREAAAKRRIGLGVTGLANALMMMGVRYGSNEAVQLTRSWLGRLQQAAYIASVNLARVKSPFPLYDRDPYLAGKTVQALPPQLRDHIAAHGIRNALLTSIAPTGTISLLAGNVSSGIEPVFAHEYTRNVIRPDGSTEPQVVTDHAVALYRAKFGADAPLPDHFVTAETLTPAEHINMQAAAQAHIDSAISKTINAPREISFEDFEHIYRLAYDTGCKGCTTYRPNDVTGAILELNQSNEPAAEPAGAPTTATANGAIPRPSTLVGITYKLRWPDSDHAMYVTINDAIHEGRQRPFEIFINSKNLEHYAWCVALTRMISAVFRRGGELDFVVEELKAVFDPRGGHWQKGRYVPSLLAAIGDILESHLITIGFIAAPDASHAADADNTEPQDTGTSPQLRLVLPPCPKCSHPSLIHQEGCDFCTSCGFSKCY